MGKPWLFPSSARKLLSGVRLTSVFVFQLIIYLSYISIYHWYVFFPFLHSPSFPFLFACFPFSFCSPLVPFPRSLFIWPFSLAAAKFMIFVRTSYWKIRTSVMSSEEIGIARANSSTTNVPTSVVSMFSRMFLV